MFPVTQSSTSILYILVPSYNPLIEENACGGGDLGRRIAGFRLGRGTGGNCAETQPQSGRELDHVGAAWCGGLGVCVAVHTLGGPQAAAGDYPHEAGTTSGLGGRSWWARWKAGRRRAVCSEGVPDKKGPLETGVVSDSRTRCEGLRRPPDGCERSQPTILDRGFVF